MFSGCFERAQDSQKSVMKLFCCKSVERKGKGREGQGIASSLRLQILESKCSFKKLLAVKSLTESPARVYSSQRFKAVCSFFLRPFFAFFLACIPLTYPCRSSSLTRNQSPLDPLQEHLVMQTRLCRAAKRSYLIHKVWILGAPLVGLCCAH